MDELEEEDSINESTKSEVKWVTKPDSHCSMIKEGTYPIKMTQSQVKEIVDGTFGGHFEHFANGHFRFIAYTD